MPRCVQTFNGTEFAPRTQQNRFKGYATFGKNIALARVDVAHAEPGTALEVGKLDGQEKRLPAVIMPLSHYDRKKSRPQS